MSDERERILARVRAALADRPQVPAASGYGPGHAVPGDPVALFAERAAEYRARVHRVTEDGVATAIAEVCASHGAVRVAVPPGLPAGWLPPALEPVTDGSTAALDAVDGVITGCACAIAETGTIVLDGGPGQGARALTLVPDLHVCVVRAAQVVATVPEAVHLMADAVRERRAPLTMISGPSATSDIELTRVEGVHGPRRLEIVIVS